MLVHKVYFVKRKNYLGRSLNCRCEGWFLFGCIPVYCRQLSWPADPE